EDGRVRVRLVFGFSGVVVFGWRGKEVGGEGVTAAVSRRNSETARVVRRAKGRKV
ncbi:hypothetical protein HAX54_035849, partial [Datura stramonium]|nr:hypothetical protein [Datura stramonium]